MKKQDLIGIFKKAIYFGPFLPLSNLFTTFFGSKLSSSTLEKIESKRNKKIKKILLPFLPPQNPKSPLIGGDLEGVVPDVPGVPGVPDVLPTPHSSFLIPHSEPIWLFWLQGESSLPPLSRLCIESIRKNSNGHPVILLTKDNLEEYVKIPQIIYQRFKEGNIKTAHFADIIRINLLAQQGGLWLDATMLLTSSLPEKIFQRDFWTIKIKPYGNFVSKCRWSVFTFASKKGNPLFIALSKIFEEYFKKYPVMVDYFMFDQLINLLYEKDSVIRKMIDSVSFSNLEVHALNSILNKEFNEKEWKSLTNDTFLFKLSNKTYPHPFHFSSNSYFEKLKSEIIKEKFEILA